MSLDQRLQEHAAKKMAQEKAEELRSSELEHRKAHQAALADIGNSDVFARVLEEIMPLAFQAIQGCIHGKDLELARAQGEYRVISDLLGKFGRTIEHVVVRSIEAETRQPEQEAAE